MAFTTCVKNVHRACIRELADADPRPVLYLDDATAGATHYFLSHGLPRRRLRPINRSAQACDEIEERTGVECVHGDVFDYLSDMEATCFSVVWLDLQCRHLPGKREGLDGAFRAAKYVCITLSSRGVNTDAMVQDALKSVRACKGALLETPMPYRGISNVTNVVRILAMSKQADAPHEQKERNEKGEEQQRKEEREQQRKEEREKERKEEREKEQQRKQKEREQQRKQKEREQQRKQEDREKQRKQKEKQKSKKTSSLIGCTVFLPAAQWVKPLEGVKMKGGCYVFRVTRTYYSRLALHAVQTNNRICPGPAEIWTLTPEQVQEFSTAKLS